MSESKQVVLRPDQLPAMAGDTGPAIHKLGDTRGNENVTTEDLVIPRIEIAQALSPCLDADDPGYIEGAVQGTLYNSLTRELYGKTAIVVPVIFLKQYLLWKDRKEGGGFRGAYNSLMEAEAMRKTLEDMEKWEAQETAQHFVFILKNPSFRILQQAADGSLAELTPARLKQIEKDGWQRKDGEYAFAFCDDVEQAMLSMSRTKLKVSRNWNSLIQMSKRSRWSQAWEVGSVTETNSNNEKYQNFKVRAVAFTNTQLAAICEKLYGEINTGAINVKMDTSDLETGGGEASGGAGPEEY